MSPIITTPTAVFFKKTKKTRGCWFWMGAKFKSTGYGVIHVKRRSTAVHRFSYKLHFGSIPSGLCVCHRCDVRHCVNPAHLFLGTQKDNIWDMKRKGRARNVFGDRIGTSKLTQKKVLEIFRLYPRVSQRRLAVRFGVTQSAISRVLSGENWKYHAKGDAKTMEDLVR